MHEVSLNRLITDYISGEEIMDTTYEDLRQSLARMLVEDKKYPKSLVRPKYTFEFEAGGGKQHAVVDIAVFSPEGAPLLALFFCPGEIGTFVRESIAAARINQPGPFPLVAVTDSMDIHLHAAQDGALLGTGFFAIPVWSDLPNVAADHPATALSSDRLDKERRILFAYTGLGGPCCGGECAL